MRRAVTFWLVMIFTFGGVAAVVLWPFERWRAKRLEGERSETRIVTTEIGAVEIWDSGGEGPVVVALHSAGANFRQGRALAAPLREAGWRVIAVNRPGTGQTPLTSGVFPEQQADLLAALLHALGVERAGLIAAAEATPVALLALQRQAERFDRAVLLTPLAQRTHVPPQDAYLLPSEWMAQKVNGDMEAWVTWLRLRWQPQGVLFGLLHPVSNWREFDSWRAAGEAAKNGKQREWAAEFFGGFLPCTGREAGMRNDILQMRGLPDGLFGGIEQPVLALYGQADIFCTAAQREALAAVGPNVRIVEVPGAFWALPGLGEGAEGAGAAMKEFMEDAGEEPMGGVPAVDKTPVPSP